MDARINQGDSRKYIVREEGKREKVRLKAEQTAAKFKDEMGKV